MLRTKRGKHRQNIDTSHQATSLLTSMLRIYHNLWVRSVILETGNDLESTFYV